MEKDFEFIVKNGIVQGKNLIMTKWRDGNVSTIQTNRNIDIIEFQKGIRAHPNLYVYGYLFDKESGELLTSCWNE